MSPQAKIHKCTSGDAAKKNLRALARARERAELKFCLLINVRLIFFNILL